MFGNEDESMPPLPPEDTWLTIRQVSKLFPLSRSFIYKMIADKRLKAKKISPRKRLVCLKDVQDFLKGYG
jgi:excisionase family DNA binding protein